jgi:hypothetical protein
MRAVDPHRVLHRVLPPCGNAKDRGLGIRYSA